MTGYEKYEYWLTLSKYDMETSKVLLDAERYSYVPVMCQQSIERMLKGMFICNTGKEASKTHNIPFLANKLSQNNTFLGTDEGKRFELEKEQYDDFMVDLMYYYMSDYPFSYKKFSERFLDRKIAADIYENSLKLFDWLEGFQKSLTKK